MLDNPLSFYDSLGNDMFSSRMISFSDSSTRSAIKSRNCRSSLCALSNRININKLLVELSNVF